MTTNTLNPVSQVLQVINAVAATPKRSEKEAILTAYADNKLLQELIIRAYTPQTSYGIDYLPPHEGAPNDGIGHDFAQAAWAAELLGKLGTRQLSGNAAAEAIKFAQDNWHPDLYEYFRLAVNKDLKAGFAQGTIEKVWPGMITFPKYMRCSPPKESNRHKWYWSNGVYVQKKMDGAYATFDSQTLAFTTRDGNEYPNSVKLGSAHKGASEAVGNSEIVLMGELLAKNPDGTYMARKDGNGLLNSMLNDGEVPEGVDFEYVVWDRVSLEEYKAGQSDEAYIERFSDLQEIEGMAKGIRLVESQFVTDPLEANKIFAAYLRQGEEGTVEKPAHMTWKHGTSKDQVKRKLEVEANFRIKGLVPAAPGSKHEGTFGSIEVETQDLLLVAQASGITDKLRAEIAANPAAFIGKIVNIKFNDVQPDPANEGKWSLSHPRWNGLVFDRQEADTVEDVLDAKHNAIFGGDA